MRPRSPTLDIRSLSVRYAGSNSDALRDVTARVEAGSILAVAGPNGAGKTTLCLAAAGLLPRVVRAGVRGSVTVGGTVATEPGGDPGAILAGLVLGDPAAGISGARASVREEIAFGLENLGFARGAMDARIDQALAMLAIEHLAEASPERLSGGEQQRVAIAAALAMDAALLVLDEAAGELDPAATAALAALLPRLASSGTAILAADHAAPILRNADRLLILDNGAVVAIDAPEGGLDHPALRSPVRAPLRWAPLRDAAPPAIEVRAVSYRYPGGVEALRAVSLAIEPGQAVAIVGENGSGKSTLAKHLMGLLRPTHGSVTVDGRLVTTMRVEETARTMGFLFQDARDQLFGRTVEAAVAFGPRNLRLQEARVTAAVDAALEAAGLDDRRTTNPHDLDLAARKQVALAGLLAMDPAVYVLDEPTTGQDAAGLARVVATVEGLRAAGRTIVAITHDLGFAARAFDRVVVMRGGELVDDGPPERVLAAANAPLFGATGRGSRNGGDLAAQPPEA